MLKFSHPDISLFFALINPRVCGFFLSTMNWDINAVIALAGLALAFTTTILGAIVWYAQTEKKKYAAERDFNHLRRNIEQLTGSIDYQTGELDKNFENLQRDILEIKMHLGMKNFNERD